MMTARTRKVIEHILANHKDEKIINNYFGDFGMAFYRHFEDVLKKEIGDTICGSTFEKYVTLRYTDLTTYDEYGEEFDYGYWTIGELREWS